MGSRKSMKLPIIVVFIVIAFMVYLFANIKQTTVTCEKKSKFVDDIQVKDEVVTVLDGKKIKKIDVTKKIILPSKYLKNSVYVDKIKSSLDRTLEYLGDNVKYVYDDNKIIVKISVSKNEVVLLNNIRFVTTDDLEVIVDSNTKSSNVVTLTVGDNYTDGEFMKRMKKSGYSCK